MNETKESSLSRALKKSIYDKFDYYHSKRKCVVGVCAMKKKSTSKTMRAILDRLRAYGTFHIEVFDEDMIFNASVDTWPLCDCLIAFYSTGFPLHKAVEYVKLRQPFCVNDVESQYILKSRIETKNLLKKHGMTVLPSIVIDRSNNNQPNVIQTDEYIEVDGERMRFPLVEKPFDADDHNIHIYYGFGKGSRRLFRKVGNRSSQAYPNHHKIRDDKSYIYEPFLSNSRDVKVYTLGPGYAHAEIRKAPSVDGHVLRDLDDKELRLSTILRDNERNIARKVVKIFKQNVCGFDIIRHRSKSYIIDVNGWSFVKSNMRFDDKAARTLRKMFLYSGAGRDALRIDSVLCEHIDSISWDKHQNAWIAKTPENTIKDGETGDILRGMVCLFRHGDRTPKQKIKVETKHSSMLKFYYEYCQKKGYNNVTKELKWIGKNVTQVLPAIEEILKRPTCDDNTLKLTTIKDRLESAERHSKFQLKPVKFDENNNILSLRLICKWGGGITHTGIEQTENYASLFTEEMFPPIAPLTPHAGEDWSVGPSVNSEYTMKPSKSFIFNDPTYLKQRDKFFDDIKVYASDEARVRSTAKAFLRGLNKWNEVTSDMVVTNDEVHQYLDLIPKQASELMQESKTILAKLVNCKDVLIPLGSKKIDSDYTQVSSCLSENPIIASSPTMLPFINGEFTGDKREMNRMTRWGIRCLRWLHRRHENGEEEGPRALIDEVYSIIKAIGEYLHEQKLPENKVTFEEYSYDDDEEDEYDLENSNNSSDSFGLETLCKDEKLSTLQFRWRMLIDSFYNDEKEEYDITKVPDLYDTIKYDTLHNIGFFPFMRPLYRAASRLSSFVVPQEYGLLKQQKLAIGQLIAQPLINQMINHLNTCLEADSNGRVALYFSSESHLHSLRNVLLLSGIPDNDIVHDMLEDIELSYMSHCVIRLYEDVSQPVGSPERFYVSVQFSPGACLDPFIFKQTGHLQLVSRPMPVCGRLTFETFRKLLSENDALKPIID